MTSYFVRVQFEDGSSVSWVFTDEEKAREAIAQAVTSRLTVVESMASYRQRFDVHFVRETRP